MVINEGTEKCKFKICDKVGIIIKRNIFDKGYIQRFSDEIFTIDEVKYVGCPVYFISPIHEENRMTRSKQKKNNNDESFSTASSASRWYYENELVRVTLREK